MLMRYLSRSLDNAFQTFQLLYQKAGWLQQQWRCFPARIRANAFCHKHLQSRPQRTIKPTPCRSRNSLRTNPALSQLPSFFNILKCKSSSRESLVHFLSTAFPDRGPETRDTDPTFATPGATILVKTHGFARESGFTHKFTCSRIVTLL